MKIDFDEKDKRLANKFNNEELKLSILSPESQKCSLELKINDVNKCEVFLSQLIFKLRDYTKEELGFEVSSISMVAQSDINKNLRNEINEVLDKYCL